MNEPPDALDRRIDAALARHFAAPPSLAGLAARTRPRRAARFAPWLVLAVAAGALASLFLRRGALPGRAPARVSVELARNAAPVPPGVDATFCRLIGPLLEGQPATTGLQSPDLVRLYHDMDSCQRGSSDAACGAGDFLAERLSVTYGQALELRPEASGQLHGPFGSDLWPTGTIVTSTSEEGTAVLVADRGDTLACCLSLGLPKESGLQLFTWQVGAVVLAEISPFQEPRLLTLFE